MPQKQAAFKTVMICSANYVVPGCTPFSICHVYFYTLQATPNVLMYLLLSYSSVVRPFRHIAALTVSQLVSSWIKVQGSLTEARETAQYQLSAEEKKKSSGKVCVGLILTLSVRSRLFAFTNMYSIKCDTYMCVVVMGNITYCTHQQHVYCHALPHPLIHFQSHALLVILAGWQRAWCCSAPHCRPVSSSRAAVEGPHHQCAPGSVCAQI